LDEAQAVQILEDAQQDLIEGSAGRIVQVSDSGVAGAHDHETHSPEESLYK
jgi:hypothetical protein